MYSLDIAKKVRCKEENFFDSPLKKQKGNLAESTFTKTSETATGDREKKNE